MASLQNPLFGTFIFKRVGWWECCWSPGLTIKSDWLIGMLFQNTSHQVTVNARPSGWILMCKDRGQGSCCTLPHSGIPSPGVNVSPSCWCEKRCGGSLHLNVGQKRKEKDEMKARDGQMGEWETFRCVCHLGLIMALENESQLPGDREVSHSSSAQ